MGGRWVATTVAGLVLTFDGGIEEKARETLFVLLEGNALMLLLSLLLLLLFSSVLREDGGKEGGISRTGEGAGWTVCPCLAMALAAAGEDIEVEGREVIDENDTATGLLAFAQRGATAAVLLLPLLPPLVIVVVLLVVLVLVCF